MPTPTPVPRAGLHPILLAIGSALLLWMAYHPVDQGHLAWIALAPLFLLIGSNRRSRTIYLASWLGGEVFWLLAVEWVRRTDPSAWLAWVTLATYLALYWPLFIALARLAVRRLKLPLVLAAPILWVGLEYFRSYALTGFPWFALAHSQYNALPLIQVSDLTGAWGVSFLVAMVNALWVDLLTRPLLRQTGRGPRLTRAQTIRIAAAATLLVAALGYGFARMQTAAFRPGPRIALLQSNIRQELKMARDEQVILATYARLIEKARADPKKPDLIVWPETSYPYRYIRIDPTVAEARMAEMIRKVAPSDTPDLWRKAMSLVADGLHDWTNHAGVPMLIGATTNDVTPNGLNRYNSALLFRPGSREVDSYHKLHLVPFGEYVPLLQTLPWLTRLTPYNGDFVPSLTFGPGPSWFDLNGLRYSTAICFEDSVPEVTRRFFAEAPKGHQPDVLLNISNDGWFQGSAELDTHLAVCVFRAVENRVPIARAVNTGISALIDGNGRIRTRLGKLKEGLLTVDVPLDDRRSFYSATGDWFALGCLAMAIGFLPVARIKSRRESTPTSASSPDLPKPL